MSESLGFMGTENVPSGFGYRVDTGAYSAPPAEEMHSPSTKIRPITITEVNRGYVVNVGCHTFAFSTKEEMLEKITTYINNPSETENTWWAGDLFGK